MKKCDYFKDLILTDFIDGQLDKNIKGSVETHLLDCGDCQAFLKEVKNNTVLPFAQTSAGPVPGMLWDTIKQRIEDQQQQRNPLEVFINQLQGLFTFPKLVPILGSLVLMFLAGSVTLNTIQVEQGKEREQGEYLVSLLSPTSAASASESSDSGTPIEHYFL